MPSMRVSSSAVMWVALGIFRHQALQQHLADTEDAPREQRDHQHQAEAKLPGGRKELRQEVRQRHMATPDERAMSAVAAKHQNGQHGGGR